MRRRTAVKAILGAGVARWTSTVSAQAQAQAATEAGFEEALAQATSDAEVVRSAHGEREGLALLYQRALLQGPAPRLKPSTTPVSKLAVELLVKFEVSSEQAYKQLYRQPVRPGGASGVTIGIGYDLGYHKPAWVKEDWSGPDWGLPVPVIDKLCGVCGLTGDKAEEALSKVADVVIEWPDADKQFRSTSLPRFVAQTERALQNTHKLSPDSLGALVSLVFNRGASFGTPGDRYREMNAIAKHMKDGNFGAIPDEILSMRRLWANDRQLAGVVKRRELEAELFKLGLPPRRTA